MLCCYAAGQKCVDKDTRFWSWAYELIYWIGPCRQYRQRNSIFMDPGRLWLINALKFEWSIKPKFMGMQNTLRGEDSMLQPILKRGRVWEAAPAFTATHHQTLLCWDASSLCSFALSHFWTSNSSGTDIRNFQNPSFELRQFSWGFAPKTLLWI